MKTRIIVSAIIEKDWFLLFGKKEENIWPYPNTWHLIWWWIKDWESLNDWIKREVKEETWIEIEIIKSLWFDEDIEKNKHLELTHYVFLVFMTKYVSWIEKASDDIKKLKRIKKDNVNELNLNKPTIKLFKKIWYIN